MRFSEAFEKWQKEGGYLTNSDVAYFRKDDEKNNMPKVRKCLRTGSSWYVQNAKPLFDCWFSETLKDTWQVQPTLEEKENGK